MHPHAFTPLLSSTPTIPILYDDVDASTRRWRPSSLLPLYINKGHLDAFSGCLGGFCGGEERCRGARGKMWSGPRSGCIRPSIWVVVGPSAIFLPSSSLCLVTLDILLPGCATQLLATASSVVATVFLGGESIRLGLGRRPTRRLSSLASSSLTCILFPLNFHFIFQFLRFCCR